MRILTLLFILVGLQSFSQIRNIASANASANIVIYEENKSQKPEKSISFKEYNTEFNKYKELCVSDSSETITYSALRYKDGFYIKFDTTVYPSLTPTYAGFMHYLNHYTIKNNE